MCCKKQLQYFSISIKTSVLIFQLNNSFQSKNKPNASLYFLVLSELPQLRRTQNYSGISPLTEERGLSSPRASSCCPLVTWGVIATAQPSTVERGISFDFRRQFHKRRRGKIYQLLMKFGSMILMNRKAHFQKENRRKIGVQRAILNFFHLAIQRRQECQHLLQPWGGNLRFSRGFL